MSGCTATTEESKTFGLASVTWEKGFPAAEGGKAKSPSMSERRISRATGASSGVKYRLATVSTSHRLFKWTQLLRSSDGQRGTQPDAIADARSVALTTRKRFSNRAALRLTPELSRPATCGSGGGATTPTINWNEETKRVRLERFVRLHRLWNLDHNWSEFTRRKLLCL